MEELSNPGRSGRLTEAERNAVIAAARCELRRAARDPADQELPEHPLRLRTGAQVTVGGLLVLGILRPRPLPLCFKPTNFAVCPSGVGHVIPQNANEREVDVAVRNAASSWDIPIVAMVGVIAAAISAAVALRKLHGTSTPYALPVALAVLKLPTGALTAVLGLLLMRGGFVPGLSALDNPAQIILWAILFGYAQQLFTRLVDDRAHDVLNQVGGQERPMEPRPTSGSIAGNLSAPARSNGGPGADPPADENQSDNCCALPRLLARASRRVATHGRTIASVVAPPRAVLRLRATNAITGFARRRNAKGIAADTARLPRAERSPSEKHKSRQGPGPS